MTTPLDVMCPGVELSGTLFRSYLLKLLTFEPMPEREVIFLALLHCRRIFVNGTAALTVMHDGKMQ